MLDWIIKNQNEIVSLAAAVTVLLRGVPSPVWYKIEKNYPRIAGVARLVRALFPDLVKALRVAGEIWKGKIH